MARRGDPKVLRQGVVLLHHETGMSQEQFADACGMDQGQISRQESGSVEAEGEKLRQAPAVRVNAAAVLCCRAPAAIRVKLTAVVPSHRPGAFGQTAAVWVNAASVLSPGLGQEAPEVGEEVARV